MLGDVDSTRYLQQLQSDNDMVEVRHINGSVSSRWFDNHEDIVDYVLGGSSEGNYYTTINRPARGITTPAKNDHIQRVTRIFFDLDPCRPSDVPATETELQLAIQRATDVATHLDAHGWPAPARAISGNGAHLHYRTALLCNDALKETMAAVYKGLDRRFSDASVRLDITVRNPARICTLYGTVKRKGESTPARPHREATITTPTQWLQVRPWQLRSLAKLYAEKPTPKPRPTVPLDDGRKRGDWRTMDIASLFRGHGLYVRDIGSGKHYVSCPWKDEHTTASPRGGGDTLVFDGFTSTTGYPGFYCAHAHCEGRYLMDVARLWDDLHRYCAR